MDFGRHERDDVRHRLMLLKHCGLVALGLAVPLAACWACSASTVSPSPLDAGADSALVDGRVLDAQAQTDAAMDAAADAEAPWLTGDWDPVSCPGTACTELIARDPATSVGALKWKPCSSGRAGCTELVVDWTTRKGATLLVLNKQAVSLGSDGKPRLLIRKLFPSVDFGASDRVLTAVIPLTEPAVFATALQVQAGMDSATWSTLQPDGIMHGVTSKTQRKIRYAMHGWNKQVTSYDVSYDALGGGSPVEAAANASNVLQFTYAPMSQRLVNLATQSSAPFGAQFDGPLSVSSGFVGLKFAAGLPLTFLRNDGALAHLHGAPVGRTLSGFAIDQGKKHLVWVESGEIAPASDSVLFEAPFAEKEEDIVPHRVTAFDDPGGFGGGYMIAHNGVAVLGVSHTRILVTDLITGNSSIIDADAGKWFGDPLWIDTDEVWLSVGTIRGNGADFDSIHRITRASLGAPTIPPK